MRGLFKHWSQVQPLVDKFSGAAHKGFDDLNKAVNFMIVGGVSLEEIKIHEDIDNVDVGESVIDFAARNNITINPNAAKDASAEDGESDTEEKYIDATDDIVNTVYIDGSCLNNGGQNGTPKAGIGVYWGQNHELNVSEPVTSGKKTSNTAELLSAIRALDQAKANSITNVLVKSDSNYVVQGITSWIIDWKGNNWINSTGNEVQNKDLWLQLDALNSEVKPKWQHVRREFNVNADKLSRDGAEQSTDATPVQGSIPSEKQSAAVCAICQQDAARDVISCSTCYKRVHFTCSGLPNYQIAVYRKSTRKYTCELCVVGAGNVSASDARKSCGAAVGAELVNRPTVNSSVQCESESQPIPEEIKCIKEDVAKLKGCFGNLESEILKIVSQLCDENNQMRENAYVVKSQVAEKERSEMLNQLQKCENREKEMKVQMDNMRDKNTKLSVECENLRENIIRRKEAESELKQQVHEKEQIIADLKVQLQRSNETPKSSSQPENQGNEPQMEPTNFAVHSDVKLTNRFEPNNSPLRGGNTQREEYNSSNTQHRETNSTKSRRKEANSNDRSNAVYVKGHRDPLSNFYPMEFKWHGVSFHSVEQAFQHVKASKHNDMHSADRIMDSKHAGIANKIGRDVRLDPRWNNDREGIMFNMLREKVRQCKEVRDELLRTGENDIINDAPDSFWGIGRDGKGRNVVGKMLFDIRRDSKRANDTEPKEQPSVSIIGSSIIKNLDGKMFSRHFRTEVKTAYTIPQAEVTVKQLKDKSDVIVYQLLSNDLKEKDVSENECVHKLQGLVTMTKKLQPGAKIIISLPPNRRDTVERNNKTNIINASVKALYSGDKIVSVCDNTNLSWRGEASKKYISTDGVHPTPAGDMMLFANIRQAVWSALTQ